MRKVLLICLLVLLSFSLSGQSPRLISMGNVNGYIPDDSDIFTYPATINLYGNNVYGYLGSSSMESSSYNFGFNYQLPEAVIGVYFNKPFHYQAMNQIIELEHINLKNNFQMFLGFKENLAFNFSLAMDSYLEPASPDDDDTEGAVIFGFGAGYSTDNLDLGLNVLIPGYVKETNFYGRASVEEKESKMVLDFNGRSILTQSGKVDLVGKVDFELVSGTYEVDIDGFDDITRSLVGIDLGLAGVINIDENNLLVLGMTPFGFEADEFDNGNETQTQVIMTIPAFNIGLESKLSKWLVLRSGIEQRYFTIAQTMKENDIESTQGWYDSEFSYNMGLGIMFKDFTLDCVFNKDFLHNGANFITGESTSDIFGEIMLKYNFK